MVDRLAENWPPADAYPVVVKETEGKTEVDLVDFFKVITVEIGQPLEEAARVIRALLRERAVKKEIMPFPSSLSSLKDREGYVAMVSTQGWSEIEEEVVE